VKLYFFPVAPNPTRVRLYLAEKAEAGCTIELDEVLVNLPRGEQREPEHLARNPAGGLPVLELDDGSFLTESLAIVEYLEDLHPEPSMWGDDPASRAHAREIERIAELRVLHPIAWTIHTTESPLGWPPNPPVAKHFQALTPKGLDLLNDILAAGRTFLAGERVSMADCTLQAAFQFARFRKLEVPEFDHVRAWDARYRERPAAKRVLVV
jgi:glutathione S-transferase